MGQRRKLGWLDQILSKFAIVDRQRQERHERRLLRGTAAKPRPTCTCAAYPWPHRPAGGLCRYPDPPLERFKGKGGKTTMVGMTRRSAIRRLLLKQYALHPIRDRELVRRWLPKLYVAWCYRNGDPYPEAWFGGYVPAMLVTASGPRAANAPKPRPFPPGYPLGSWRESIWRHRRSPLRGVERRRNRRKLSVTPAEQ